MCLLNTNARVIMCAPREFCLYPKYVQLRRRHTAAGRETDLTTVVFTTGIVHDPRYITFDVETKTHSSVTINNNNNNNKHDVILDTSRRII